LANMDNYVSTMLEKKRKWLDICTTLHLPNCKSSSNFYATFHYFSITHQGITYSLQCSSVSASLNLSIPPITPSWSTSQSPISTRSAQLSKTLCRYELRESQGK
jgi:hypothetical protein